MALFSVCAFWMAGVARLYSSWNKVRRLLSILIHRQVELQEEVVSAALFPQLVSPNQYPRSGLGTFRRVHTRAI